MITLDLQFVVQSEELVSSVHCKITKMLFNELSYSLWT